MPFKFKDKKLSFSEKHPMTVERYNKIEKSSGKSDPQKYYEI